MRCLYCGKEVALFKRLRGGEFCSDAHRQKYQEEYTELALHRLALANASKNGETEADLNAGPDTKLDKKLKDGRAPELESPALKRRENADRDEPAVLRPFTPQADSPVATMSLEEHNHDHDRPEEVVETYNDTHISEPLSAPAALAEETVVEERVVEEPPSPPVHGFMMETDIPIVDMDRSALPEILPNLASFPAIAIPRLPDLRAGGLGADLDHSGAVDLPRFAATDAPVQPVEREVEVRMFVRGAPQVEVPVQSAVESGFDPVDRALDVEFEPTPPAEAPQLWSALGVDFPSPDARHSILLGDLARLDFELTSWGEPSGESAAGETAEAEAPAASAKAEPAPAEPPLGPPRIDSGAPLNTPVAPAPQPPAIPVPVRFDPVHINPVFMEKIAGTVTATEPEVEQHATQAARETPEALEESSPEPVAEAPLADAAVQPSVEPLSEPEPSVPSPITKPMPVTLHGVAPTRGKTLQVFTSAVMRAGALQIPREAGLPLRPLMVLGPAVKPSTERLTSEKPAPEKPTPEKQPEKPAAKPESESSSNPKTSLKSIPALERRESRKSDARVVPMPVKEQKSEPANKPEPVRQSPIPKPEPVKEAPAVPLKEVAALKESAPAEPKPAKLPVEIRPATPAREVSAPATTKSLETAAEEDLLGLPKLSIEKESAWSRLPQTTKLIVIAAVLALVIGGIFLTTRGSGAPKAGVITTGPVLIEETPLANDAGWTQDWFADRGGAGQNRHVDVLRGSLALRDFRLLFEGQIEQGAIGWVFRANNKSFYVEKIQVVTPGLNPVVALVRFAVINGKEQPRTQTPLDIQAHLDTMYKVRMDVVGDHFTTWVQDNKVDEWADGQLDAGGVGLYYENGDSAKLRDTLHVIPLQKK